jgi:hypothetical protein
MRVRSIATGLFIGALLPGLALGYTAVFRVAFTSQSSSNPTGIAVGDFDQDGAVDAAVSAGDGGSSISVQVGLFSCAGGDNAGQFCFGAAMCPGGTCKPSGTISNVGSVPLNSFPSALLQGRFDGDALDDLIVAQTNDDSIVFLKGLGDTHFFAEPGPSIGVGPSPVGLAGDDIDGDGTRDVVVANEGVEPAPGSITILKGAGDGTFTLLQQPKPGEPGESVDSLPAELGTRAVAIGNVVGDSAPDILALNVRSNTISIFSGDGDGIFTPSGTVSTETEPQDLALRDLNGDGDLDLIIANFTDDSVSVRLGNGDGTFTTGSLSGRHGAESTRLRRNGWRRSAGPGGQQQPQRRRQRAARHRPCHLRQGAQLLRRRRTAGARPGRLQRGRIARRRRGDTGIRRRGQRGGAAQPRRGRAARGRGHPACEWPIRPHRARRRWRWVARSAGGGRRRVGAGVSAGEPRLRRPDRDQRGRTHPGRCRGRPQRRYRARYRRDRQ